MREKGWELMSYASFCSFSNYFIFYFQHLFTRELNVIPVSLIYYCCVDWCWLHLVFYLAESKPVIKHHHICLIAHFANISATVQLLTLWAPHADDEAIQLTAQEVALLLQLLDALLQPGILLQSDVEVSSQVWHQDEGAVLWVSRLLRHRFCRKRVESGERKTWEEESEQQEKSFQRAIVTAVVQV